MLQLVNVHGGEPVSWKSFCRTHPRYSIGLDGYVAAATQYDARGPWLNLDHHADVDRLATRATCAQVLLCLRQGLLTAFWGEHGPQADVYVNDCDEDVCLSWYLLKNSTLAQRANSSRLERLVQAVDILDTTAGASLGAIDDTLLREMAWVFHPYRQARLQGNLDLATNEFARAIIDAVTDRIDAYVAGDGKRLPLDTRYKRLGGGDDWSLVHEIGGQSRLAMAADGIDAYVSVRQRVLGDWSYTIGRISPFIRFDIPAIFARLNQFEDPSRGTWGGGNLMGGSPRRKGSGLSPGEVTRIVDDVVKGNYATYHRQRTKCLV